jgi:hypothetical protein
MVMVVALAGMGLALPAQCRATDSDALRKEVAHLTYRLVHLPAERSAPAQVSQLVVKLSRLAPEYANGYFRWGISKLPYRDYNGNQTRLADRAIAIVKASSLPPKRITKIIYRIRDAVKRSAVPEPTPYQA